jgi:outer membrane protein OmpA-like peptidoglycan-associated protein
MHVTVRLLVVALSLSLAACFNKDHIDVANMTPSGSAFQAELHSGYSDLSKLEYDEGDWNDGYVFMRKARSAAQGEDVPPELVWDWDVPGEYVEELSDARETLGYWMRMGAAERLPVQMAKAQVMFDCWIQEQEENYQPNDIARCRDGYYAAIAQIEAAMTWPPDVEEPMAMPQPAVQEPVLGKPRFYTVFFDWDKADINPVAQRVIDAVVEDWVDQTDSVHLEGHTDRSGSVGYNQSLSEKRVDSVTGALSAQGFGETRISGFGVGETNPAVSTADGVREPRNRRVTVTVE